MARQGDETTRRGYTSLDDVDAYPKAAYRDRDGRHYEAPGLALRFDDVEACRKGRSPLEQPGPGRALLDVFVCTTSRADGTGVLLLDGDPIASGDGRYQVQVEPGRHRLEVQGYDASTTEFDTAAGERVCFTTGHSVAARRQTEYRTELYRVRDPGGFMPLLSAKSANASGIGCLLATAGIPLIAAAAIALNFVSGAAETVVSVLALAGVAALVTGSTMGIVTTRRFRKRANEMRMAVERTPQPLPGGFPGQSVAFPSAGDARDWARERQVRGALLVFDLFLYRLTRHPGKPAEYAGTGEALAFAHADGLRLTIDGVAAPCDWASWFYPLAAGEHRFTVEYGNGEARHEFSLNIPEPEDVTVVHVPVQVFRLWNAASQTGESLEPRIANNIVRKARSAVGDLNRSVNETDTWIPPRYWPLR